jgi:Tfp pilus assembly protein FimT
MTTKLEKPRPQENSRWNGVNSAGFSLTELLVVVLVVVVMGAISVPLIDSAIQNARVESGLATVMGQLRHARQLALDNRRNYRITFTNPRTMTISRIGSTTLGESNQQVIQMDLPSELRLDYTGSVPVPDNLGSSYPIILQDNRFVEFRPDGSVVNNLGQVTSAVAYLSKAGEPDTNRAVTVFGATGRVRGFRYNTGSHQWQ